MRWRAGHRVFEFPRSAMVMGVLNVTPDSFSDGGRYFVTSAAVAHGLALVEAGADLLDIGGESTRPGAEEISVDEELRRVLPVVRELVRRTRVPLSIDTRHPEVAEAALKAGAVVVNDIGANRTDPALWQVVARHRAGYVAMHMLGEPRTMQQNPVYQDVVTEVHAFFGDRLRALAVHGVEADRVVLDPGIGFGKSVEHNLALLRQLTVFTSWDRPLLLGVSRKSFFGKLLGAEVDARLPAGLACTLWASRQGAGIFRTHDVSETVQALRMQEILEA